MDTTPATIEVLPEIVKMVRQFEQSFTPQKKIEIWFDGGIRRGSDVLKALAIGADFVWIGRPVLWGLTNGGQKGVESVLKILNEELKECMLECGCQSIDEIKKKTIIYKDNDLLFAKL